MKVALLCVNSEVLAIAREIVAADHQIVAVFDVPATEADAMRSLAPVAVKDEQWESLLGDSLADVVLVGFDVPRSESIIERLRKLAQAAVPLVPLVPVCESIIGFEIEMIQHDTGVSISPYVPDLHHPAFAVLSEYLSAEDNALGDIEQLVVERQMLSADREAILRQLARDVQVARQQVGELKRVSGMGDEGKTSDLSNLSVHMSGPGGVLVRWSTTPGDGPLSQMTFIGTRGRATLEMAPGGWRLDLPGEESRHFAVWNSARPAVGVLEAAAERRETSPTWADVCRSSEIAETAERSVRKGKTIELHHEPHTQEATFKGMMAAGGCLLLMLTFGVMLAWSLVEGIRYPAARAKYQVQRDTIAQQDPSLLDERPGDARPSWPWYARVWPVYPFAIFLALQLLRLVFQKKPQASNEDGTAETEL